MIPDTGLAPPPAGMGDPLAASTDEDVRATLATATGAAAELAAASPAVRRSWLHALADALDAPTTVDSLVDVADQETRLGRVRLEGELARCANQLRFYGDVAAEGSFLAATIDHARDQTPDLRRLRVPLGPVAVLGASNFPFAFGVLGNDTASAVAAGCPVVVKAHPAHPLTSRMLAAVAEKALAGAGSPPGTFSMVAGFAAGQALVQASAISAVAFTGSQQGGMSLWRLANDRDVVIPVYAEMGTVNPVVMTAASVARLADIATGFVGSFTLGSGQFCTKPGLLIAPAGHDVAAAVGAALTAADPRGWMLTERIAEDYGRGVADLVGAGATVVSRVPTPAEPRAAAATVMSAPLQALAPGSRLLEECFGPLAIVVEYADAAELAELLDGLHGALAGSVFTSGPADPDTAGLVATLASFVGRVAVDDWPTGVAFTWGQQHGGPWPATTAPAATSVGAAALDRFTRPVTWQSVPDGALPVPLRDDNPWDVPRRVNGRWNR
jgi:NADP-dependent aldehyde dehydrogenase